jgi:outer membrane murein-binding lipoprotein Lpp
MQKTLINQRFLILFVLSLFFLVSGCSNPVKNCKISPDYERIGESVVENSQNLTEAELKAAKMRCNF